MKPILLSVVTALLSSTATYFIVTAISTNGPSAEALPSNEELYLEKIESLEQKIEQLQAGSNSQLTVTIPADTNYLVSQADINNTPKNIGKVNLSLEEILIADKQSREFKVYLDTLSAEGFNLGDDIENKFLNEETHYTQASIAQDNIYAIFEASETLQDLSPNSIECHSIRCQITFTAQGSEEMNLITSVFNQAYTEAATRFQLAKGPIISAPHLDQAQLKIYVLMDASASVFQ